MGGWGGRGGRGRGRVEDGACLKPRCPEGGLVLAASVAQEFRLAPKRGSHSHNRLGKLHENSILF